MPNQLTFSSVLPYKSVALALVFAVLLGPVGLLYASFWGGFTMIVLAVVMASGKYFFLMFMVWVGSCIWAVGAVEKYNRKNLQSHIQLQK